MPKDKLVAILSLTLNLYKAVEDNNIEDAKDLVQRTGIDPNLILPEYGISCFHLAVGVDSVSFSEEVTRLFLNHGGNPNVRSCEGLTPVHVAAIRGRVQNLHLLLLAGGDPQAVDEDGCSPMYYAHKEGNFSCVELLQSYKCMLGKNNLPYCSPCINKDSFREREEAVSVPERSKSRPIVLPNIPYFLCQPGICLSNISEEEDKSRCKVINENNISASFDSKKIDIDSKEESVVLLDDSVHAGKQSNCWLASQSCFSNSNELNCHDGKIEKSECTETGPLLGDYIKPPLEREDDNNLLKDKSDKSINLKEVCDNTENELNILDTSFKLLDVRSSNEDDSITSVSNQTYNITDDDNFLHRTYNIFSDSILSSDRSSPLLKARSIAFEKNNLYDKSYLNRSNSDSTLSSISPVSEKRDRGVTYRRNFHLSKKCESNISINGSESEEYFTVPEEIYEYTDKEKGVALLEKRISSMINVDFNIISNLPKKHSKVPRSSSECSLTSYNTDDLRNEVRKAISFGYCCPLGPITATTKRVYLRKVHNFKKDMLKNNMKEYFAKPASPIPKFSSELERTLAKPWLLSHSKYIQVEQRMMAQFDEKKKFKDWREGSQKSSFNYLLLDPRITNNLPLRWASDRAKRNSLNSIGEAQYWKDFLSSIFYVGKGKRSRPYSHLYEAVTSWRNGNSLKKLSKKVKYILEIWNDNAGVVCLHVFQNTIPAEAFTREAAIIDALGLRNLKNERRGEYYGIISSLSFSEKREFGSFLLHRALMIYLNEGERQLKPADID